MAIIQKERKKGRKKGRKERKKGGRKKKVRKEERKRKKERERERERKKEKKKEFPSDHSPNFSCLGDSLKSNVRIQTGPVITLSRFLPPLPQPPPKVPYNKK